MTNVELKLKEMGYAIPEPGEPVGSFCASVQIGDIIYVSGHTSNLKDVAQYFGKLGKTITTEEAYKGAEIAALRCIGALNKAADLDYLKIVKVTGFVNSAEDFTAHPTVINGASNLFEHVFGEKGRHARCAIGVASLPGNACVEVELIAQVLK